MHHLDFISQ